MWRELACSGVDYWRNIAWAVVVHAAWFMFMGNDEQGPAMKSSDRRRSCAMLGLLL